MNACLICPQEMVAADLSFFLPCPWGFVYVSSPLCRSTKTMDVAHDAQLPQTSMRRQVVTMLYFLVFSLVLNCTQHIYCLSTEFVLVTLLHLLKVWSLIKVKDPWYVIMKSNEMLLHFIFFFKIKPNDRPLRFN